MFVINVIVFCPENLEIFKTLEDGTSWNVATASFRDHEGFEMTEPFDEGNDPRISNPVAPDINNLYMFHLARNEPTSEWSYPVISDLHFFYVLERTYDWHLA